MTDRGFPALILFAAAVLVAMALASPMRCGEVWRLCSFDAQILPYSPTEARAYLAAIGPAAVWRYLWIVQPLDLVFPALLCLVLREHFARRAPERPARRLGRLAVLYAGADYLENAVVRVMLERPAGDFSELTARIASALTSGKWLLLAALFAAAAWFWRRRDAAASPVRWPKT
ncbi:MAG: hypothetical protein ACK4NE_02660 [Albidovulum sp.]